MQDVTNITNWKLPMEMEKFSRQLAEILTDSEVLPAELIEDALQDNTNIMHYVNILLRNMQEIDSLTDALSSNIEDLMIRKKRYEKKKQSVENFLQMFMERYLIKRMECPNGTVTKVVKSDSKVIIEDETAFLAYPGNEQYLRTVMSLDKSKIKEALQNGIYVSGARLAPSEYIQVRR